MWLELYTIFGACGIICRMKIRPWLQLFRLPNLPTAPGDALAGAAVLMCFSAGGLAQAVAAGATALGFYMFGLADNDIVGAPTDGQERPIPRGDISMRAARAARALCLAGACSVGACARMPSAWWGAALALVGTVIAYNRTKGKWLMGLCRGLSVACGAFAVWRPACDWKAIGALACLAGGWTLYGTAITWLSEGEEQESDGLGNAAVLWGLTVVVPGCVMGFIEGSALGYRVALPGIAGLLGYVYWLAAVIEPLAKPHGPDVRRQAVGRAVRVFLYLQVGCMLVAPCREFVLLAAALWVASRIARRIAPEISGS